MSQNVLSVEEYNAATTSAVAWAQEALRALESLIRQGEELRQAVVAKLEGHVHELSPLQDAQPALAAECVAVPFPGVQDVSFAATIGEFAAWSVLAAPVLRHQATLRPALEAALRQVAEASRGSVFRRHRADVPVDTVDGLRRLEDWGDKTGYTEALRRLAGGTRDYNTDVGSAFAGALALALGIPRPSGEIPVVSAGELSALKLVASRSQGLLQTRERLAEQVKRNFSAVREQMVARRLRQLTLSALKEASGGQTRTSALESAGVTTVQQVLDLGESIAGIPGIGRHTATVAVATARQLKRAVKEDLRLRIDLDENDTVLTALVCSLHNLLDFESRLEEHRDGLRDLVALLSPLMELPEAVDVVLLHRHSPRRGPDVARHLIERAAWIKECGLDILLDNCDSMHADEGNSWEDFKSRAAEYYGLLGEIVGITVDVEAAQGRLPKDVVEAVHEQDLDTARLKVSLRGYQAFGARYALVQRHVIVGDEMGLGKTVQALAVMAHLSANGAGRFLVVCPTAVLVNWTKEIRKHSHLEPTRVHGPDRELQWSRWRKRGGVAVTSYDTLWRLPRYDDELDLLVVDEAHFIKNPETKRAATVREYIDKSSRVTFLTGTPLENRVQEFENLVSYLQPEVARRLNAAEMVLGAHKFREAVAPVYLRRNSDDVLTELPDLVEVEEWLAFTDAEEDAYLDALNDGAFEQMRRVAFTAHRERSSKLERLEEIVIEAAANDRKVVVFSYFREVLDAVAERLGERVIGSITGSTSADGRQLLVDRFTDATTSCVLLSQVVAGGVGLNLQAASVVVICEPQVKPALEDQAVKRAHRMGQVRSVQVHRLLTEKSVDERMLDILARKSTVFEQYAAHSDVATASPEALDITEAKVAKEVLAREQERLATALRARNEVVVERPTSSESSDGEQAADELGVATIASAMPHRPANSPWPPRRVVRGPGTPWPQEMRRTGSSLSTTPVIPKCNSCGGTYDFNGHCGCS